MITKTKLRQLREQQNMTLQIAARRARISKSALGRYEQGLTNPEVTAAIKIADALGVKDLRELWGNSTPK